MDLAVQWGDVGTWVGGLATALALFVTYGLLRITRREQRAAADRELQLQARQVSAWCTVAMSAETKGALWNGSDEPVYDPKVAVAPDWVDDFDRFALAPGLPAVLAPRERVWWVIEEPWEEPRQFPRPVEVLFADVAGRYWRRDCYGGLHEIRQKSFPGEEVFFKFEPRWPDFWPSPAGRWLRLRRRLRQGDLVRSRPSAGRRRP